MTQAFWSYVISKFHISGYFSRDTVLSHDQNFQLSGYFIGELYAVVLQKYFFISYFLSNQFQHLKAKVIQNSERYPCVSPERL